MLIRNAAFVKASQYTRQCPESCFPEYAFIGRSNVGKSSLINMLTNRKNLAHTSSTPGKTQLINHFIINNQWHLVDLPGYGYARSSKIKRMQLSGTITDYIMKREQLTLLFVLLDSRHEPQHIDIEFITRLGEISVPFAIIFTKADKLGQSELRKNIELYQSTLLAEWEELPPMFVTSAETGAGRDDLLTYIEKINKTVHS